MGLNTLSTIECTGTWRDQIVEVAVRLVRVIGSNNQDKCYREDMYI